MPSFDSQFNVNWEVLKGLKIVYEALDDLQDIRIGLERGLDTSTFLSPDFSPLITFLPPPFDPLRTIGKYC
jgi:hypothetical protein